MTFASVCPLRLIQLRLDKNPYVRDVRKYSDEKTSKSGAGSNLDAAAGG